MVRQYTETLIRIRSLWEAALIYPENFDQILRSEFQETPEVAEEILDYMHGKLNNTPVGEDFDRMFTNESQSYGYGVAPQGVIRGLLLAEQGMIRQFLPDTYQDYYRQSLQELNAQMRAAGMTEFEGSRYVKKGEDAWYFNLNLRHGTYRAHGNSDGFVSVLEPIAHTKVLGKDAYARFIAHTKAHVMLHQLLDGMVGINHSSYGPDSTEEAFVELYARLLSGADPSEFTGYYDLRTHRLYQLVQEAAQVQHMTPARVLSEILKSMKKGYITITRALNRYLPEYCEGKCPSLPAGTTYLQYMDGYMDAPGDRKLSPDEAENLTSKTPIIGGPYLFNRALEDKIQNLNSVPFITVEQFQQLSHDDQIREYAHLEQLMQFVDMARSFLTQNEANSVNQELLKIYRKIEALYPSLSSPYKSERSLIQDGRSPQSLLRRRISVTGFRDDFIAEDVAGLSIPQTYEEPRKVIDVDRLLSDAAYRHQIIVLLLKLGGLGEQVGDFGDLVPWLPQLVKLSNNFDAYKLDKAWDDNYLPIFQMLVDLYKDLLGRDADSPKDETVALLGSLTQNAMEEMASDSDLEKYNSSRKSSEAIPKLIAEGKVKFRSFGTHNAYIIKEKLLLKAHELARSQNPIITRTDGQLIEQMLCHL